MPNEHRMPEWKAPDSNLWLHHAHLLQIVVMPGVPQAVSAPLGAKHGLRMGVMATQTILLSNADHAGLDDQPGARL